MSTETTRREFWKVAALSATGLAASRVPVLADHDHHCLPAGIAREDLVNLVDGPWMRLRAVLEKKVIDFHTHNIQLDDTALTWTERAATRGKGAGEVDYTAHHIRDMDVHGIEKAVVQPPMMAPWVTSERWLETIAPHPTRLLETATSRGRRGTEAVEYLRSRVTKAGARIIQGPGGQRSVDEERPFMELAEELSVPVVCNIPADGNYGLRTPEKLVPYIKAFPKVTFVLEDGAGKGFMTPAGHIGIQMAVSFDNLYWIMDGAPIEFVEGLVKTVGAHRVLFGSDLSYPFIRQYLPAGHRTNYLRWRNLNAVALADLTEDQRDFILHRNARRLLKLDTAA